eukprot:4775-Heterococcus_DN1.PRE.4
MSSSIVIAASSCTSTKCKWKAVCWLRTLCFDLLSAAQQHCSVSSSTGCYIDSTPKQPAHYMQCCIMNSLHTPVCAQLYAACMRDQCCSNSKHLCAMFNVHVQVTSLSRACFISASETVSLCWHSMLMLCTCSGVSWPALSSYSTVTVTVPAGSSQGSRPLCRARDMFSPITLARWCGSGMNCSESSTA